MLNSAQPGHRASEHTCTGLPVGEGVGAGGRGERREATRLEGEFPVRVGSVVLFESLPTSIMTLA